MPDKPTRGPYEGSEIINYGKDPIKGYYRDIKLKSGLVRRDWNGAYDKETQARKQREEIAAEKKLGSFSNRGLQQVGENMMVLGGGGAVAGTIAALNAPTIAKKLYKFANRNNKPIPASSTKTARIGRQRELASSTTPSKIRNYTDPSTRKVRPVAGTPRIRMTRDQINERLSYEGKKGTEAMAERAPIAPGRRVMSGESPPPPPPRRGGSFGSGGVRKSGAFGRPSESSVKRPTGLGTRSRSAPPPPPDSPPYSGGGTRSSPGGSIPDTPPRRGGSFGSGDVKKTGPFGRPSESSVTRPTGLGTRRPSTPPPAPSAASGSGSFGSGGVRKSGAFGRPTESSVTKPTGLGARKLRATPPAAPRPGYRAGADGAAEAAARKSAMDSWPKSTPATAAGKGAGFMGAVKKYGKLGGKVLGGIAAVAGASELYDRLAPKDYPRAPWMSRGNKPTPPAQVTQEQPFVPSPGGTSGSGGGNRGGSGGGSTMTQEARASQRAIRKPDDYLGEAFDATLRKGVNKGTAHLEHMMQMDKLDEDTRANLRNRFKKVQGDQILSQQKDKGIVERLETEKAGRGANLLKAYRKEGGFDYGKKGDYFEIKRQAEAGTEYAK